MANSKITLTFNSVPSVDTLLDIVDSRTGINMIETFKANRTAFAESKIGSDELITGFNYHQAFNIDYNNTLLYTLSYNIITGVLVITANNPLSQFSVNSNTTAGAVTTLIENVTPPTVFDFTTIVASEATTDPCDNVKLTSTLSEQADTINSPISQAVGVNPFIFETVRGNAIDLEFQKGSDVINQELRIPLLLSAYFNIDIVNTPNDASITVERLFPLTDAVTNEIFPLTFQYSLDGVVWQTSSSWSGIVVGNHTMYVKDNLGCEINFAFTIDAFTPNLVDFDAVAEISKVNAIRFKKNEVWDNVTIFKTEENTLSFEEDLKNPFTDFVQLVQKNDTKTTQIKTNYTTQVAVLIDCDDVEIPLTITKKTSNMDITDVRDVSATNITSSGYVGRLGVYYGAGNTYDPDTLVQNGTYNLGTELPTWINIGDYISLQGFGWVRIDDIIVFNGNKTIITNALFVDSAFSENQVVQGTSVYNVLDFERYEFTIPFTAYEGFYKVKVNLTHATFPAKEFISEWLHVKAIHPNHHLIEYYHTVNNEIRYSTGITHRLRLPFIKELKWKPNVEQDIYVSNTNTISLKNKVRDFYDFSPMLLPTVMAQQLILVLGHDRLQIDTVNYVLEDEPESNKVGNRNKIEATLVKANYVFDSNSGASTGEITLPTGSPLAIDGNAQGLLFVD